jgi:dihydroorotase
VSAPAFVIRNARHWKSGAALELAVADGVIGASAARDAAVIDAGGALLAPGLVDVHVHLREPGQAFKESIATGTRAAAAGGFTAVCAMPNTDPVVDSAAWIEWILKRAAESGHCRVHPIGAVTMAQQGERLTPAAALRRAGLPIIAHEEDLALRGDGQMNEGVTATRLGLPGIPAAAESVMARRDIDLAALTGGRLHLAHLSCAASFDAVRDARRRGLKVSAETCPHYWTLTDEAVGDYDTNAKMNPPLRSAADREAVIAAIREGLVDCLATDHAPHTSEEKGRPFDQAPFGIVGLETAFALTVSFLVLPGHLTLARALELWTEAPRRVMGLPEVRLEPGFPADLALLDPAREWTVDPDAFHSMGRNSPFAGWRLTGQVLATVCGGRLTHADSAFTAAHAIAPAGATA